MPGGRNGNLPAAPAMQGWREPCRPPSAALPCLPSPSRTVPSTPESPAHPVHGPAESTPRSVRAAAAQPAMGLRPASMPRASIHSAAWRPRPRRDDLRRPCSPPTPLAADTDGDVGPPIAPSHRLALRGLGRTDKARRIPVKSRRRVAMHGPLAGPMRPTRSPRWRQPWDRDGGHGGNGRRRRPPSTMPRTQAPPPPLGGCLRTRSAHAHTAARDVALPPGSAVHRPPTPAPARLGLPTRRRPRRRKVPRRSRGAARCANHSRCPAGTRPSPRTRVAPAWAEQARGGDGTPSPKPAARGARVSRPTTAIAWPMVGWRLWSGLRRFDFPVRLDWTNPYFLAGDRGMGGSGRGSKREGSRTTWRMRLRFQV